MVPALLCTTRSVLCIGNNLSVHLIKHTLSSFTVSSSDDITCVLSAHEVSYTNIRDHVTAFLSMVESPRSANMWFNDPDAAPVLSQIFKTYHAERHTLQMKSSVEQQQVRPTRRSEVGICWSSSEI